MVRLLRRWLEEHLQTNRLLAALWIVFPRRKEALERDSFHGHLFLEDANLYAFHDCLFCVGPKNIQRT